MSAIIYEVSIPATQLPPGVRKTIVQIKAPTNQRVRLKGLGVYFDGVNSGATPIELRLLKQTTPGAGLLAATPTTIEPELSEIVQSSAQLGVSTGENPTEPTAGPIYRTFSIPAFMGVYECKEPFLEEIIIGGGDFLAIDGLNPSGQFVVNIRGYVRCEE